jgi:hypothetical protein
MTKDGTSLGQTLSIVHDAHEHIMRFPSQAPDSGERGRTCIHLFERIVNQAQSRQEVAATQGCCCNPGQAIVFSARLGYILLCQVCRSLCA